MSKALISGLVFLFSAALYAQTQDTIKPRTITQYNLSGDFSGEITIPFDTVFSLFHRYRHADRYSPVNATLGNYGLPFYQISFFDRIEDPDKYLVRYYYPLVYQPENYIFMNTQKPFTELVWTYGGAREKAEQTFRIRHSQNVNRFLNFGLDYKIIYSLGQYSYQRSNDKDFTFFTSYRGEKYKMYMAWGLNHLRAGENGGISNPDQLKEYETRDVSVSLGRLNSAKSYLRNWNMMLVNKYTPGKIRPDVTDTTGLKKRSFRLSGTFSHILLIDNNRRTYSDDSPGTGFYDSIYISNALTFDSLSARSIKNTIRFDFVTDTTRKFRLGGGVGLRNEMFRYGQIIPTHIDTMAADTASWRKTGTVLVGRLYNNIGDKFNWSASGELFFSGYRAGDFILDGVINKVFDLRKGRALLTLRGSMTNRTPSIWFTHWGSNNFEWQNSFNRIFRMNLGAGVSFPARNLEMKFNYAIIDNYTDFDTLALPSQHTGGLSVASLHIRKDLRAWKFHLASDVLIQKSSNAEILDLPLVTVKSAGYFEHLFRFPRTNGALNTQLGADVTYHTLYNSYSYIPATGIFHRQDKIKTGNYPFINVFLNIKLKRTRIFIMVDHVNSGLTGYEYYMVPFYPQNVRMFRYGIAWTFYD
ncbi:MAG TPA: hypothetical protein PLS58_12630 [Bacteroidales bacterium]|jgi:hypothetical protein|nr:hypothetical protein [Bacteroidales bacterium]